MMAWFVRWFWDEASPITYQSDYQSLVLARVAEHNAAAQSLYLPHTAPRHGGV